MNPVVSVIKPIVGECPPDETYVIVLRDLEESDFVWTPVAFSVCEHSRSCAARVKAVLVPEVQAHLDEHGMVPRAPFSAARRDAWAASIKEDYDYRGRKTPESRQRAIDDADVKLRERVLHGALTRELLKLANDDIQEEARGRRVRFVDEQERLLTRAVKHQWFREHSVDVQGAEIVIKALREAIKPLEAKLAEERDRMRKEKCSVLLKWLERERAWKNEDGFAMPGELQERVRGVLSTAQAYGMQVNPFTFDEED